MQSGRVATSQAAGIIRKGTERIVAAAAVLLFSAAAGAQTFSADPAVFPTAGANTALAQTVLVHVVTASAIGSITIPLGFVANPDFVVLGQTGCVVDGATVNPAGTVCSVSIGFRAIGPGLRTSTLAVTDGSGHTTAFGISGTGYFSQVAITPSAARISAGLGPTAPGFSGDGGIASLAAIHSPQGIAADSFGNVFFADTGNNVVRMLDAFGNITTIAGGGTAIGASADGGPATAAVLSQPTWLAVDTANNLYIAETGSHVIRRIGLTAGGIISTYAGSYIAGAGDGTSALAATLHSPTGIVLDTHGNLYIADTGNQLIRRVDASTGGITTVAGSGATGFDSVTVKPTDARFNAPTGLALDLAGNLYIADAGNHAVRMLANGSVSLIAGNGTPGRAGDGGPASAATLTAPSGLAVDAAGDVLIGDSALGIIRRIEAGTGIIDTIAGSASQAGSYIAGVTPSTDTPMNGPTGLALDATQNLYIADSGNHVIRRISGAPGELLFSAQATGNTSSPLTAHISNIGNAPLAFTSVTPTGNTSTNFIVNSACTTAVAPGSHCIVTAAFSPQASGFQQGEIDIVDNAGLNPNFTYTQPIYLAGGIFSPITIGPATLPAATINTPYSATITASGGYGAVSLQTGTVPAGLTATATGNTIALSGAPGAVGTFPFTVYASDALGETAIQTYTLAVSYPVLTLNLAESVNTTDSLNEIPGLQLSITETIQTTDTIVPTPGLVLNLTESIQVSDTIQASVQAKQSQTITVPVLTAHTYGDAPFALTATSTSGLPVTVAVTSGPAVYTNGQLNLTGAGQVNLSYTQVGDSNTEAAPTQTQMLTVTRASATLTALDTTRPFSQPNPTFAFIPSGLVHGDTPATLGGAPSITTTAVANFPAGTYPITVAQGTLPTTNYTFTFVPATLTITGHVTQIITFLAVPNVPLSVGTLTLTAHSTSGLAITYLVQGSATITKNKLQLTGAGTVTVTAIQAGNATYDAASPVVRSFTVIQ
jgi:hypothetical protein